MHLLRVEHVVEEVFRVASPIGATLVLGRLQREKPSFARPPPPGDAQALAATRLRKHEGQEKERGDSGRMCSPRRYSARTPDRGNVAGAAQRRSDAGFVAREIWLGWPRSGGRRERECFVAARCLAKDAFFSRTLEAVRSAEEKYVLEGVRLSSKS